MIDVKLKDTKSGMRPDGKVLNEITLRLIEKGYDVFVPQNKTGRYAEMQVSSNKNPVEANFRQNIDKATEGLKVDYDLGRWYVKFSQSLPETVQRLKKKC